MTFRLVFGVDPGVTGAIAVMADGEFLEVHDMPTRARKSGREEVNGQEIARVVREIRARHVGAAELVAIEDVAPMPSIGGGRGMGATSAFQYGRGLGVVETVFEILGVPLRKVHANVWKRQAGLIGQEKDQARTAAMLNFPKAADLLRRKKDCARAESILIAQWGSRTLAELQSVPEDPFGINAEKAAA